MAYSCYDLPLMEATAIHGQTAICVDIEPVRFARNTNQNSMLGKAKLLGP
jgi:hypothetical protein